MAQRLIFLAIQPLFPYLFNAHPDEGAGTSISLSAELCQSYQFYLCCGLNSKGLPLEDEQTLVEVYSGPVLMAEYYQSLLEAYGVEAFLKDEIRGSGYYWPVDPARISGVKVLVSTKDVEAARSIIEASANEGFAK